MDSKESYERAYIEFINYQTKASTAFQAIQHIIPMFMEESTDDRIDDFISSFVFHTSTNCETYEDVISYIYHMCHDAEDVFECQPGSVTDDVMSDTLLNMLFRQLQQVERVIQKRGHLCKESTFQYMLHKRDITLKDMARVVAECIFYEEL